MWIDITMPLHKNMPIWPGDTPFQYRLMASLEQDGANVGDITMSLHAGTHIDAPFHYDDFGKSIDVLPIELFIGPVLIVELVDVKQIQVQHVAQLMLDGIERIFFKTKQHYDLYRFDPSFTTIHPEVVQFLAGKGVRVVGTDAPSVDPVDNSTLQAHHAFREVQLYIIENLYVKDVKVLLYLHIYT